MISWYLTREDLPGAIFRTAFYDHAFVTQIGIVSHPLKTPVRTLKHVYEELTSPFK
jgi:hypothetical protein